MFRRTRLAALFVAAALAADVPPACDPEDAECLAANSVSLLQHEHWIVDAAGGVSSEKAGTGSSGMAREAARVKLRIEQDLSKLSAKHYRLWDDGSTCYENADKAWHQFISNSGLQSEMNAAELHCFEVMFDEHVTARCKNVDVMTQDEWREEITEAFEAEKPSMTATQAASMNAAHTGHFTVTVPDGCVSKKQMDDKCGRDNSDAAMNASLLEAERSAANLLEVDTSQIPASFDSATQWPACSEIIERAHNQGTCGSCWAFAGTSVLDSLFCIKTGGAFQLQLSRTVLTSCASSGDGCGGGWEWWTFQHIKNNGVPTGGGQGCVPYFASGEGTDHFSETQAEPPCPTQCVSNGYSRPFSEDSFTTPGAPRYTLVFRPSGGWDTALLSRLKEGMMMNGPAAYGINANSAFMHYAGGVFDASCTGGANHAVVVLGWAPYNNGNAWKSLNSWGAHWGENGMYKVVDCVITDYTIAGAPSASDIAGFPMDSEPAPAPKPKPKPKPSPDDGTPASPTEAPTTPPPTSAPAFSITGDGCSRDADGCVSSNSFPSTHGNNERCKISNFPEINVVAFNTERKWDWLKVNGEKYSGTRGPQGIIAVGDIEWRSDGSVVNSGWKICPSQDGGDNDSPSSLPTSFPSMPPTMPWSEPTSFPSMPPTMPWNEPTGFPTMPPTEYPTEPPTEYPTEPPTAYEGTPDGASSAAECLEQNALCRTARPELRPSPLAW